MALLLGPAQARQSRWHSLPVYPTAKPSWCRVRARSSSNLLIFRV